MNNIIKASILLLIVIFLMICLLEVGSFGGFKDTHSVVMNSVSADGLCGEANSSNRLDLDELKDKIQWNDDTSALDGVWAQLGSNGEPVRFEIKKGIIKLVGGTGVWQRLKGVNCPLSKQWVGHAGSGQNLILIFDDSEISDGKFSGDLEISYEFPGGGRDGEYLLKLEREHRPPGSPPVPVREN